MALTSIVMNCFERMVMMQINSCPSNELDSFRFNYHHDSSIAGVLLLPLHSVLDHWHNRSTNIRSLFINCSLVFNPMVHFQIRWQTEGPGLCSFQCNWIPNVPTRRPQSARINNCIFSTMTISKDVSQCCSCSNISRPMTVQPHTVPVPSLRRKSGGQMGGMR